MSKSFGVLGSGIVGRTLAKGIRELGHQVTLANREGSAVEGWDGEVGTYEEVTKTSEAIVLAIKGSAAEEVVASIADHMKGKTVIDTTNPMSDKPPDEGVLDYFTSLQESLMERLQSAVPDANFVKAFNSVGNAYMVNPRFTEGTPTMFICGNDAAAKNEVSEILSKLGWESADMGGAKSARAIEPLCILWCLPGMLRNEWSHAFKLLKT